MACADRHAREPFPDPATFPFVTALEAAFSTLLAELHSLPDDAFVESPDSLSVASPGYDERGWLWMPLLGSAHDAAHQARCPAMAAAIAAVPGVRNAGLSLLRPGTHLEPHCGELPGVLRCHLALVVPRGDVGIRAGTQVRSWHAGRCLILDDSFEHEAWNHGDGDRVVLLITFARG